MRWDEVADVIVVGSGGAALTAATLAADGGARILVVEKSDMIGGTTAVSGGVLWIPRQRAHGRGRPGGQSPDDALAYVRHLAMGVEPDPDLLEVFVDTAPEALAYLEAHTPVTMTSLSVFPDYYFPYDVPGKKPGGRSVEPVPYAFGAELPEWRDRLVSRGTLMSLGVLHDPGRGPLRPGRPGLRGRAGPAGGRGHPAQGRGPHRHAVEGAARLGTSASVCPPRHASWSQPTAPVVGVRAEHDGHDVFLGARRGVVLACGGFEWNRHMVRDLIGYEVHPLSPPNNVGDGLVMATEAGAALANLNSYWGTPAMFDPAIVDERRAHPPVRGGSGHARIDRGQRARPPLRQRGGALQRLPQGVRGLRRLTVRVPQRRRRPG